MLVNPEPLPIPLDEQNRVFAEYNQLRELYFAIKNLGFTARDGAIQNYDKAGNFAAQYLVFTSNGSADTEDTVPHNLTYIPNGYIVVNQDKAAILYDSGTAFTTTNIYLKSSATSVAWTILVF